MPIELPAGAYFGERALIKNEPRAADVIAHMDNTVCLTLDKSNFNRLLGPLEDIMRYNVAKTLLAAVPFLKTTVDNAILSKIAKSAKEIKLPENECVYYLQSQNQKSSLFFLHCLYIFLFANQSFCTWY